MAQTGEGWTTDVEQLNATRAAIGLSSPPDGLAAWETVDLLLVTAPWFDVDTAAYPPRRARRTPRRPDDGAVPGWPALVALTFSTTEMAGQAALVQRVCDALHDPQLVDFPSVRAVVKRGSRHILPAGS